MGIVTIYSLTFDGTLKVCSRIFTSMLIWLKPRKNLNKDSFHKFSHKIIDIYVLCHFRMSYFHTIIGFNYFFNKQVVLLTHKNTNINTNLRFKRNVEVF